LTHQLKHSSVQVDLRGVMIATGSASALGVIPLMAALFGAYWLPLIVAVARKVPNAGSVAVVNLFLGWTFVGWVVALAMACRSRAKTVVWRDHYA
jgi:hypothetical protein